MKFHLGFAAAASCALLAAGVNAQDIRQPDLFRTTSVSTDYYGNPQTQSSDESLHLVGPPLSLWQSLQAAERCLPSSTNPVVEWSKAEGDRIAVQLSAV